MLVLIHKMERDDEDEGYITPDDTRAEFSLTPIASPTKYKEEHSDLLTEFITHASGFVDIIERFTIAILDNPNYSERQRYEREVSDARCDLNDLREQAITSPKLRSYVRTKFNITDLASFLDDVITTMKKESRDLMKEAHNAGAKAAKKSSDKEHIRRKQSAERKRKQNIYSSNDHGEPTPICGPGGCTIALRL